MDVEEFLRQARRRFGVLPANRPVYVLMDGRRYDLKQLGVSMHDDAAVILVETEPVP